MECHGDDAVLVYGRKARRGTLASSLGDAAFDRALGCLGARCCIGIATAIAAIAAITASEAIEEATPRLFACLLARSTCCAGGCGASGGAGTAHEARDSLSSID